MIYLKHFYFYLFYAIKNLPKNYFFEHKTSNFITIKLFNNMELQQKFIAYSKLSVFY